MAQRNANKNPGRCTATREQVARAYFLRFEEGYTYAAIGTALGFGDLAVRNWIIHPEKWDPFVDEIAVERALLGEREVYDALTVWEEEEFVRRYRERRDALITQIERNDYTEWLQKALGLASDALTTKVNRLVERESTAA